MSANTDKDGESCPLRFDINGMHCAACSSRIERVVGQMPGVEKVTVNLATAKAQVWAKPGDADLVRREVMDRVAKLGFSAVPATDADAPPNLRQQGQSSGGSAATSGPPLAHDRLFRAPAAHFHGAYAGLVPPVVAGAARFAARLHARAAAADPARGLAGPPFLY